MGATLGDFGFPHNSGFQVEPAPQAARFSCCWCFSVGEPDLPEVQSWAVVIEQTGQPTSPSGWVAVTNASDRDGTPDSSSLQVSPPPPPPAASAGRVVSCHPLSPTEGSAELGVGSSSWERRLVSELAAADQKQICLFVFA